MLLLKILGAVLGLFLLLMLLRVGVEAAFGEGGTRVCLRIGLLRFQIVPAKKKTKQDKKTEKKPETAKKVAKPAEKKRKLTLAEWKKGAELLLPALYKALRRTRRAIRVQPLRLHITLGGDDPAAVGQRYGWGQALLWTVMPQAEQLLTIPDPHIRLDADFDGGGSRCEGEMGVRFRIGSMLLISLALLPPMLRWLRVLRAAKDAEKAEAKPEKQTAAETAETAEDTPVKPEKQTTTAEDAAETAAQLDRQTAEVQPEKMETAANDAAQAAADDTAQPTAQATTAEDAAEQAIDDRTKPTSDDTTDEKGGHYGK